MIEVITAGVWSKKKTFCLACERQLREERVSAFVNVFSLRPSFTVSASTSSNSMRPGPAGLVLMSGACRVELHAEPADGADLGAVGSGLACLDPRLERAAARRRVAVVVDHERVEAAAADDDHRAERRTGCRGRAV